MSGSIGWPARPDGRGSPKSSPTPCGNQAVALPGRARWGARSTRQPPWAGAHARAGGAGTSHVKSILCNFCRSPSARSSTGSVTAFAAISRASLRCGHLLSTCGAAGRLDRVGDVAAAWPPGRGPVDCGEGVSPWGGPTPRARTEAQRTKTRAPSCGTIRNGRGLERHGVQGSATRRRPFPNLGRQTSGRPPCGRRAFSPPAGARGGSGALRRVPVRPIRHVPGGPCDPHGCEPRGPGGPRGLPVLDQPRPRPRKPYPLNDLLGPLPGYTVRNQPWLRPGAPPGLRWPQDFVQDLVRWAKGLAWMPRPSEVSLAELAPTYEAFVGRALLASPDHRLRCTHLLLGERAQLLCKAPGLLKRHLVPGTLLRGAPLGRCPPLLPLRSRVCARLSALLFSAALVGPAPASAYPHAAAAGRLVSHGFFLSSPRGAAPLAAVCHETPTGVTQERPARRPVA